MATPSSIYRHLVNHNDQKLTAINGPIPPCAIGSKQDKSGNHQRLASNNDHM